IESAPLIHCRSHRSQRHVERVAKTTTVAGFTTGAGARIPGILVHRKIEKRSILIKDALRAVTVMYVPIDDGDSLDLFISLLCVACGHGDIIEKTKAHRSIGCRVMARWPQWHEGIS